jgi:hypothetical protein
MNQYTGQQHTQTALGIAAITPLLMRGQSKIRIAQLAKTVWPRIGRGVKAKSPTRRVTPKFTFLHIAVYAWLQWQTWFIFANL